MSFAGFSACLHFGSSAILASVLSRGSERSTWEVEDGMIILGSEGACHDE